MENLQEFVAKRQREAARQIGRYQGQEEAFEIVQKRLDPKAFCQECGYEYSQWHLEESLKSHQDECPAKPKPAE